MDRKREENLDHILEVMDGTGEDIPRVEEVFEKVHIKYQSIRFVNGRLFVAFYNSQFARKLADTWDPKEFALRTVLAKHKSLIAGHFPSSRRPPVDERTLNRRGPHMARNIPPRRKEPSTNTSPKDLHLGKRGNVKEAPSEKETAPGNAKKGEAGGGNRRAKRDRYANLSKAREGVNESVGHPTRQRIRRKDKGAAINPQSRRKKAPTKGKGKAKEADTSEKEPTSV